MSKKAAERSRVVPATEFKARCLALIDRVAAGKGAIVISKRGRLVARLVAIEPSRGKAGRPLVGSVRLLDREDDLFSTNVAWEADARPRK